MSQFHWELPKNRVNIPIKDEEAAVPFFMNTLKKNRHIMDELLLLYLRINDYNPI